MGNADSVRYTLSIPDLLTTTAGKNTLPEGFPCKLEEALRDLTPPLNEDKIWRALAGSFSESWREYEHILDLHNKSLEIINMPENRPLGLIGMALDGKELRALREKHSEAQAQYTLIDEMLRDNEELTTIFNSLLEKKEHLENILPYSSDTKNAYTDVTMPAPIWTFKILVNQFFRLARSLRQK